MPCTGPPPRFMKVRDGGPFATARARRTSPVVEQSSRDPTVQVGGCFGALSGGEKLVGGVDISSLCSSRTGVERSLSLALALLVTARRPVTAGTSPRRHLYSCLIPSVGPAPRAPVTDSPALRPLHSIPFHFRRLQFHSMAFRRSQTVETVNDTSGAKTGCNNSHQAGLLPGLVARRPIRNNGKWRCLLVAGAPRAARTVTKFPVLADRARA